MLLFVKAVSYTHDAADEEDSVDLGGRVVMIKKLESIPVLEDA